MLRALGETEITGVATTIPADLAILAHPDFIEATHSTNWVEERLDPASFAAPTPAGGGVAITDEAEPRVLREVTAEVDGRRYAVKLWVPDDGAAPAGAPDARDAGRRSPARPWPGRGRGPSSSPCRGPS